MSKKYLTRKEIHRAELEILKAFDKYCRRMKLTYWMAGGTLLGAVRHKGFIPWDDDIDIGMPRPDYERLLKLVKEKPVGGHYRLLTDRDDTTAQPFAQLVRTDLLIEKEADNYLEKYRVPYLWMDIFPIDGFPKERWQKKLHLDIMAAARFLSIRARATIGKGTSPLRMLLKMPVILLGRLFGVKRLRTFITQVALLFPYERSREVGIAVNGYYGPGEAYLKKDVFPRVKLDFEGEKFYAPACYKRYLRGIYGDYMKLPPKEKRKTHKLKVRRVR